MSRALVAIGVSRCGSLTALPGAISDANEMAAWATSQGYESVKVFTDEGGGRVVFADVYQWISDVIGQAALERLIICYAGHGYAPLPGHEVWLLSDWETDANQAINASGSLTFAQGYARPQISFIADACRTTGSTNAPVYGSVILPRPGSRPVQSEVDQFYATKFGFTAQEWEESDAVGSFGVFSRQVRLGLKGAAAVPAGEEQVVTSRSLEDFLDKTVPELTGQDGFVQIPDTIPQWKPPRDVYARLGPAVLTRGLDSLDQSAPISSPAVRAARDKLGAAVDADRQRFMESQGRVSFETRSGASVIGAVVQRILGEGDYDVFEENGAMHVRARGEEPVQVLLELARDGWSQPLFAAVSIYPNLIATLVVGDPGVESVNYVPSMQVGGFEREKVEATAAVAEAAAFLSHGLRIDAERARALVGVLRRGKDFNPALAILAANVCHRLGDWMMIEDMTRYDIGMGPYVPYDVAILSPAPVDPRRVVGSFPALANTWAALATSQPPVDDRLFKAARELTPSLWTTIKPEGARILAPLVDQKVQASLPFAEA